MKTKYGLFMGDFHCGHLVGLTPPAWQLKKPESSTTKRGKWHKISKELWLCFTETLRQLPEIDFLVVNGDMIEGKESKSGGTELITSDMQEQCDMAVRIVDHIRVVSARRGFQVIGTYGTPYHTSTLGDDWENKIAEQAGFNKIGGHEWLGVNGLIFDIKHKVSSSSVPHGRHTSTAREGLWNDLWSLSKMQPKADVIIRSHVHYYQHCGTSDKLCMTLPALQGMGSKFGSRECSGLVDWGMVLFSVKSKTDYTWNPFVRRIEVQRTKVIRI